MSEVRLINAIELVRYMCGACPSHQNGVCIDKACWKYEDRARIENAPTIEAEPVHHGRWINGIFCSECNRFPVDVSVSISNQQLTKYFSRCPHCGAKMDGG